MTPICIVGDEFHAFSLEHTKSFAVNRILAAALLLGGLADPVPQALAQGGVPLWTNRYQGPSGPDQARSIVTDSSGNVLVSGVSTTTNGLPNYATVKYSNVGAALGTNRYTGITNSGALEVGMAVDGSGNVFVVGYSPIVGAPPDYATVAYSSAGTPLWTNYYSEPVNGGAFPQAIAVDGAGNVIVTGGAAGGPSGPDYVTIKYSNAGVPLWTNRYNGPAASSSDIAYGVAVDSTSNIVVTGGSTASGSGVDIATIKYSSAGVPLWTNRYNGPGNANDQGNAVAVDANGNVFVTGYSIGLSGNQDFLTLAYSSAGAPLWTNRYHGTGGSNDRAVAIAVDASGNVVVTGLSNGANYDYATIKYSSAGVPLWTNRYNGPANNDDSVAATAVDSSGNVFVTGAAAIGVSGTGTFTNAYATVAYSSSGVPLWTNLYGPGSALAIALDSSGNVFVTGQGGVGNPGYATIKYSSSVAQGPSPIYLDFQSLDSQLVLSWTNPIFSLQTAPTLSDTFTNITGAASPYTNSITGNQQFSGSSLTRACCESSTFSKSETRNPKSEQEPQTVRFFGFGFSDFGFRRQATFAADFNKSVSADARVMGCAGIWRKAVGHPGTSYGPREWMAAEDDLPSLKRR